MTASIFSTQQPAFRGGTPTPFSLTQLPVGAIKMDLDPASGITQAAGTVSQFVDTTGTITLTQATGANQPTYTSSYALFNNKPALTFDGATDIMSGTQLAFDSLWLFHVAERKTSNNTSTTDGRTLFEFPRSTGSLRCSLGGLRSTMDAAQTTLRTNAAGATLSGAATPFGIDGLGHVLIHQVETAGPGSISIDGADLTARRTTNGATTLPSSNLGGSTTSAVDRLGMVYGRGLAVDYTATPGGRANGYLMRLIGAHLAWTYGMQALLPSDSPWKAHAPYATDYKDYDVNVQTWGNSICKGASGDISVAGSFTAKGLVTTNGGVGGNTTTQIKDRFIAGFNTGTGTTDGASTTVQRQRLTVIGDFWANGPTDTSGTAQDIQDRMFSELATMVAAVETAQGVSAGQARLLIWDQWVTQSATITAGVPNATRITQDAIKTRMRSTYPNYYLNVADQLIAMGAPTGAYPDPVNYALQIKPAVLDSDGLHPSTLGYTKIGEIVNTALLAKGWGV